MVAMPSSKAAIKKANVMTIVLMAISIQALRFDDT